MPGGDRTGPLGMGPMTGRAAGYCAGFAAPGFMNAPGGRGFGPRGGGRGRGWRNWFYATGLTGWQRAAAGVPAFGGGPYAAAFQAGPAVPPAATREQELGVLKQQAAAMEQQMRQLQEQIERLETKD